jgi:hypothetical protein
MTSFVSIKRINEECTKLCEEGTQIWTNLMEDPKMKAVEGRLRDAQEKVHKASENISRVPLAERLTTILGSMQSYTKIKEIREQQKVLQQRLVPLQEESLRVIGELAVAHSTVKQATHYNEEKLTTLTAQVVEEILEQEAEVKKEVVTTKETLQKYMEAWRGETQ